MTPDIEARAALFDRELADARDEALAEQYGRGERVVELPQREGPKTAQEADKPEARRLRFIPASEFLTEPRPPEWIIDGVAETDSFCVLFGDPESGKSFMAMDWACCVAVGMPWKGRNVRHGPVLYINGEGHNGVNRRLTAWCIANQFDLRKAPFFLSTTTTALTDELSRAEFEAVVAEFIRAHGKPAMVVIDTLARNFGPGDENSTQDMQRAVDTIDAIREMTRAWVIAIHHSGHGDKTRARGSIVLRGAADTEYRMGRVLNGGDTLLEATKMKDGNKPPPMTFRFADVELGVKDAHGHEVTSAVLIQTHYTPEDNTPPPAAGKGRNQVKCLALLESMIDEARGNLSKNGRNPDEARVTLVDWREACVADGLKRQRAYEVTRGLIDSGRAIRDGDFVTPAGRAG